MALVLFRSYVLLIVLCIFITLIDKSHGEINPEVLPNQESNVSKKNSDGSASSPYTGLNVSMDISERCELYFGINNQIKFPKNYKVHTFNVNSDSFPKDWLKETQDGPIIKLPEGYFVIVPKGFKIKLPKGETIPSNGFFDKTKGCKSHLQTGWTISPTTELKKMMREFSAINESKHGSPEGWIDIVLKGIKPRNKNHNFNDGDDKHGLEIAIEVAIPRCRIILPKKNTVVFPKGSRINFPKNRFGTPAPNWIERVEGGLIFNNLPPGSSVIIPDGYKVTAIEPCYGVPQKDWIKHIDGETIIKLPLGWIIEPTKAFKTKLINDLNTKVINHFRSQYPGVSIINILKDLESNILKNEKKNNPGVSITKIVNNFKKNNPGVSIQNELETIKKKMEDV